MADAPMSYQHLVSRFTDGQQEVVGIKFDEDGEPHFRTEQWFKKQFASMVEKGNLTRKEEQHLAELVDRRVILQHQRVYRGGPYQKHEEALTPNEEREIARWVGGEHVEDLVLRIRMATVLARRTPRTMSVEQQMKHVASIRKLFL